MALASNNFSKMENKIIKLDNTDLTIINFHSLKMHTILSGGTCTLYSLLNWHYRMSDKYFPSISENRLSSVMYTYSYSEVHIEYLSIRTSDGEKIWPSKHHISRTKHTRAWNKEPSRFFSCDTSPKCRGKCSVIL